MKRTPRNVLTIGVIVLTASGFTLALASLPALAEGVWSSAPSQVLAQNSSRPQRPPQEAMEACSGKSSGDACAFSTRDGQIKGSCQSPASNVPAACVPAGSKPKS